MHGEGFSGTGGSKQIQVGVFVHLSIEQVHHAQGIIVPVYPQQDACIIRHFKAGEHISRGRPTGKYIALCLFLQLRMNFQKWHHRLKRRLLLETAVAYIHIHGFEQIGHLLLTPHQFLVTFGRYRHKDAHVKQILIVVGNTRFDKIACLDGVGQFLIVSAGILHPFEFGPVEPDPLCHLVDGFAAVFPA